MRKIRKQRMLTGDLLVLVTFITSYGFVNIQSASSMTNVGHAPRFVHQPGNELVKAGEPKTIECPVEAEPEAEIKWYKDGQMVSSRPPHLELTGNELMFISISEQDSGEYHCQASNSMGSITSDRFKLSIQTSFHDSQMSFEPRLAAVQADRLVAFTCTLPETITTTNNNNNNNNKDDNNNNQSQEQQQQLANPSQIFFRKNSQRLPVRWVESSLNLSADNLNSIKSLGERYLARSISLRQYQLLIVGTNYQLDDNTNYTCLYKPDGLSLADPSDSMSVLAHESHSVQLRVLSADLPKITPNTNLNSPEIKLDDVDLAAPIDNLANSRPPHQIATINQQKNATTTTTTQLSDLLDNNVTTSNKNNVSPTISLLSSQNLGYLYEILKPALVVGAVFVLLANTMLWAQWMFGKWRRRSQYKKHHHHHHGHHSHHLGHHHYSNGASSGSSSNASSMLECDPVLKSLMGRTLSGSGHNQQQQQQQHQQPLTSQMLQRHAAHQSSSSLLLANNALGKKYRSYRDSNMRCKVGTTTNNNDSLHHQQPWNVESAVVVGDLVDNLLHYQANPLDNNHQHANLPNLYNQSLAAREQARNLLLQVNEQQTAHIGSLNNIYNGPNNQGKRRNYIQQRLTDLRSSLGASNAINNQQQQQQQQQQSAGSQLNLHMSFNANNRGHESHQLWTTTNSGNNNKVHQFRPNHLIDGQQSLVNCMQASNVSSAESTTNSAHSPSSLDSSSKTSFLPGSNNQYKQAVQQQQQHLQIRNQHETRLHSSSNHYSTIDGSSQLRSNNNHLDELDDGEACYEELDNPRDCGQQDDSMGQDEQALIITSNQHQNMHQNQNQNQQQQSGSSRNSSTRTTSTFVSSALALDSQISSQDSVPSTNNNNNNNSKRTSKQQLHQQADQLSPYAVSSIVCTNLPGQASLLNSNTAHQALAPPPPPMTSEAMRALNEQFNINQLMLMDNCDQRNEQLDASSTEQPVRQLIANFDVTNDMHNQEEKEEEEALHNNNNNNKNVIQTNNGHNQLKKPTSKQTKANNKQQQHQAAKK